jgi:1-acyl-sn-glycerol-3-phosphate acyltransferase
LRAAGSRRVEMFRVLRLPLLACHVAAGLVAALFLPLLPAAAQFALQALWSRGALAVLGVRLIAQGALPGNASLIVANHVSWLDVLALSAVCRASFVCKQEIASWPLLGWLLKRAGTVFMRRASAWGAWHAMLAIVPRLRGGAHIAVFPEGTTTAGDALLPFYPALFQSAVNAKGLIQPAALVYADRDRGGRRYEAVYAGETSFGESLLEIAGASGLTVTVSLLPAFSATGLTRRQAARHAQELIASRIGHREVAMTSRGEPILRAA